MPIHLRAALGAYAPAVLCPGDPRRAQHVATTLLTDARLVNQERGLLGFTGTFEGRPLSVQSTGMGCPGALIVFEELVQHGARRLVRIGTCGGIQPGMGLGDLVVALAATPIDATTLSLTKGEPHAPTATWSLVRDAVARAEAAGLTTHVGPIVTSDLFYDDDRPARWAARGHLAIEMETAALYTMAALRGVEALTVLTVSDTILDGVFTRIDDDGLRSGVDRMALVAARTATN